MKEGELLGRVCKTPTEAGHHHHDSAIIVT
jgi:hypothetical protein